ncbi:hypothetical protein [Thermomonospora umbrina]|uniref:DUF3806 domain-containing protein n=1 Tax=Thermomonospora umbrina TaxID=111806 RepID=A0A3D9SMJ8_9ACTN|nr:hypothetical protein [Thermomonospora umbrina]REE97156.1 hypothetical protein DFJ69_2613 [Thermomonospora umbrina]
MWRSTRRSGGPHRPSDAEIAAQQRTLAGTFVDQVGEAFGLAIGWTEEDAQLLDGLCDILVSEHPTESTLQTNAQVMGAYLGELIVRNGGGRWGWDVAYRSSAVLTRFGTTGFPHNRVYKRLTQGVEHSLWAFYQCSVTGSGPPGSTISEW